MRTFLGMFLRFVGLFLVFLLTLTLWTMPPKIEKVEQRVSLKFLVSSGHTPIECWHQLMGVFKDKTMSKTQVRVWKRFQAEKMDLSVKDLPKSGRPRSKHTAQNIHAVRVLLDGDNRMGIHG